MSKLKVADPASNFKFNFPVINIHISKQSQNPTLQINVDRSPDILQDIGHETVTSPLRRKICTVSVCRGKF